jgi:type IV secretion system protein TrbI
MSNEQIQGPSVRDKRITPPGILPRNVQAWVLGGVALLMVLVIAFSGGLSSKPRTPAATISTPVLQPSEDKLKEYQRRIDEKARQLDREQAQFTKTTKALTDATNPPRLPITATYSYAQQVANNEGTIPKSPIKVKIEEEKQQLEYNSLFASNIAISKRPEQKPPASEPSTNVLPPPLDPRLYAALASVANTSQSKPESAQGSETGAETQSSKPIEKTPKAKLPDLNQSGGKLYRLFEGTIIETVLTNGLDATFSGPVNCMVSNDVYSHDHNHVLIPKGSRLLGQVHPVESEGQSRIAVSFHRLIMPDGYSFNLDQFHGLSQVGETGLRDKVNHHYVQIFGASIAIGMIAGLAQTNTQYGPQISATDAYRQGVSNSLSQSSMHILDRFLNILPTFTIREGQRIKVYIAEDITLPAYENHEMQDDL